MNNGEQFSEVTYEDPRERDIPITILQSLSKNNSINILKIGKMTNTQRLTSSTNSTKAAIQTSVSNTLTNALPGSYTYLTIVSDMYYKRGGDKPVWFGQIIYNNEDVVDVVAATVNAVGVNIDTIPNKAGDLIVVVGSTVVSE